MTTTEEEVKKLRDYCVRIAAIESHYWSEVTDERLQQMAMGAMGAAANICAAILLERTPEEHQKDCEVRGHIDKEVV